MKKIILTTGGTGGHIYPALSVAEELIARGYEVIFVGSTSRMEGPLVEKENIRFVGLNIFPDKSLKNIFRIIFLICKCIRFIFKEKPDAVIGFGNYISVPMLAAAFFTRTNIFLQEQNANLGFTTKVFSKFAKKTFLAFNSTYEEIPIKRQHRFKVTGNPLRKSIYGINKEKERENLKLSPNEKVLVVIGGSLGARSLNDAMLKHWSAIEENKSLRIYWATGKNHYEEVSREMESSNIKNIVKPYFDNLIHILAAADLVICRAGALTISELIQLQKPSILLPYNSLKVGQYANALILKNSGGAYIYNDNLANKAVEFALELLQDNEELLKMESNIRALKMSNATLGIVNSLEIWRQN